MSHLYACSAVLAALVLAEPLSAAAPPLILRLRTQKAGDRTYFCVNIVLSSAVVLPDYGPELPPLPAEGLRRRLARLPRLLPLDDKTHSVCYWVPRPLTGQGDRWLRFVGVVRGEGKAKFRLFYPIEKKAEGKRSQDTLAPSLRKQGWAEMPLTLDFGEARRLEPFTVGRDRDTQPLFHDLEGLWAEGQARQLAVLEAQSSDFGFYGFAREALGRRYKVPAEPLLKPAVGSARQEALRLYEMTTGATALTESLARRRLLNPVSSQRSERIHDVKAIDGVTIAEHPWKKMMAGKKSVARAARNEALARLVPQDNYYVSFRNVRKFIEFGELGEQWGSDLLRAYEVNSRDHGLKRRYEKQLCLRSTVLGKTLGPLVIRGIALTGNDLYLREGSDVSVIFHVRQRGLFLAAVEPFIEEARKEFGKQLKHAKKDYQGVAIESYVTPLREVSLHRASFGDYIVCANSAVGLRRILDVQAGRGKALADSLDFQYMRTVFRADDKGEDGFVFLPDAFIRQLVGPASKIKEKRRLEALTTLYLLTNGALFTAWDTGKLPKDHKALLAAARLRPEHGEVPEGKAAVWDAGRQTAVSDAYGTIHFATPLIELPIDKVTKAERHEYEEFLRNYRSNWRRYFDPVGMRLALTGGQVRMEVYILPLVANSEYDQLRQWVGGGTTKLDPASIPSRALFQYTIHLDSVHNPVHDALGDWFFLRVDDGLAYRRWAELQIESELGEGNRTSFSWEEARLPFQAPALVGLSIGKASAFDELLTNAQGYLRFLGGEAKELKPAYKGVPVATFRFSREGQLADSLNDPKTPVADRFAPVIYHAKVDGAWYASFRLDELHGAIDRALARWKEKKPAKEEGVPINSSVYIAPKAAVKAAGALRGYLEWESHRRALANEPLWYALYRGGVLAKDASPEAAGTAARKFFGFVPVSPDGAAYRYESRTDEVVNARHGSLRRPRLHPDLAPESPLAQLLGQLQTVRADLRFREDGIHTVLTIQRKLPKK